MQHTHLGLALALPAALGAVAGTAGAADHREAPLIREDVSADINDVYAFADPNDATKVVLIMTVNPLSAPPENVTYNFSDDVRYVFRIDNDGDAVSDVDIDVSFNTNADGSQTFGAIVGGTKINGAPVTAPTEEPEPNEPIVTNDPSGVSLFAGQTDDPFFFDVVGFARFLAGTGGFTGSDGFAGFNVSSIALSVPRELVDGGSSTLQIWGVTERRQVTFRRGSTGQLQLDLGPFQQIERMGNPAVNTALIPLAQKDLYNLGQPADDGDDFAGAIVASLQALGTNEENIGILASVAVPDTLKLDLDAAPGYPIGRGLADDVVDTLFFFIFNQNETPDGVDANDKPFRAEFPFLAPPHQPR